MEPACSCGATHGLTCFDGEVLCQRCLALRLEVLEEFDACECVTQEGLDYEPAWLRRQRRKQWDKERKARKRRTADIIAEMAAPFDTRLCACGCGKRVSGRRKYASKECRKRAKRERDRVRKAEQRADALRQIREAEGIVERVCPECGAMFPVNLVGRPKVFCGLVCEVRFRVRNWRKRLRRG